MLTLKQFRSRVGPWLSLSDTHPTHLIQTFGCMLSSLSQPKRRQEPKVLPKTISVDGYNAWDIIVPNQLREMFEFAKYSPTQIQNNIEFYHQYIRPYLGPEPCSTIAPWKSYINDDYSPIEMTYSLKKQDQQTTVKCLFEPIETEPFSGQISNISASLQFIKAIEKAKIPTISFDTMSMLKDLFLSDIQQHANYHLCFGFDFEKTTSNTFPLIKGYIGLNSDRLPSELSMSDHVLDMMSVLKLDRAWQCVLDYLKALANESYPPEIDCISVDCVDKNTDQMRVKIYIRYFSCHKDNLIQHLTLNGRLLSASSGVSTVNILKQWHYFLGDTAASQSCDQNVTKSFLLYYEFRQSNPDCPTSAKYYFPIRHYFEDDQKLTDRIAQYLIENNLDNYGGGKYIEHMNRLCKHRSLNKRSGLHRLIAGSLADDNPEVKLYYSPELYAPERFEILEVSK